MISIKNSRATGEARQTALHHALVGSSKLAMSKAPRHYGDEAATLDIVADRLKLDFKDPLQKDAQLRHRIEPRFFLAGHQVVDDRPQLTLQAHTSSELRILSCRLVRYWSGMDIDNIVYVPYPNSYKKMAFHTAN